MTASLATRDTMKAGLVAAGASLSDATEPTVRQLRYMADYKRRVRRGDEAAVLWR